MPNHFLNPEVGRVNERLGWMVECTEPLIMMALHIPEENRSVTAAVCSWPAFVTVPQSFSQFSIRHTSVIVKVGFCHDNLVQCSSLLFCQHVSVKTLK